MSKPSLLPALLLSTLLGLPACMMDDSLSQGNELSVGAGESDEADDGAELDRDDCKIEDADIGVEDLVLTVGDIEVTFFDWIQKDGEPGEYVGFSVAISGADSLSYVVKAGGERFESDADSWLHPNGTGGPEASAISHVDFCDGLGDPGDGEPAPEEPAPEEPAPEEPGECTSNEDCGANEYCTDQGACELIPIE